jgi:hypothetical protein
MATLRGEPVDRPAVCFYELNGLDQDPDDPDPFNVYNDPSWRPLLDLTRERTDRIVMRRLSLADASSDPFDGLTERENWQAGPHRFTRARIRAGGRTLQRLSRRDRDIDTVWTLEPLVKELDDFKAWLELPLAPAGRVPDPTGVLQAEAALGEAGIVMLDTWDPLLRVADLFEMGEFTVFALTENGLMHRALEKIAAWLLPRVEATSEALPGRLWRICGSEYASPPYLPPRLFEEYSVRYVRPMVAAIQRWGGYARIHCHGRLRDILDLIAATGCDGLDPIEPPPQGDVEMAYVRRRHGRQMVLFGNLEIADITNMPTARFRSKVERALREGTDGEGRGMVLMPSACPDGRIVSELTLRNYELMVELAEEF